MSKLQIWVIQKIINHPHKIVLQKYKILVLQKTKTVYNQMKIELYKVI